MSVGLLFLKGVSDENPERDKVLLTTMDEENPERDKLRYIEEFARKGADEKFSYDETIGNLEKIMFGYKLDGSTFTICGMFIVWESGETEPSLTIAILKFRGMLVQWETGETRPRSTMVYDDPVTSLVCDKRNGLIDIPRTNKRDKVHMIYWGGDTDMFLPGNQESVTKESAALRDIGEY